MFFPNLNASKKDDYIPQSKVFLKDDHVCIQASIAKELFSGILRANWIYYADRDRFFISSAESTVLSKLHKTNQQMLKERNLDGDLSFYILELLLDNDISRENRDLSFEVNTKLQALSIQLKNK